MCLKISMPTPSHSQVWQEIAGHKASMYTFGHHKMNSLREEILFFHPRNLMLNWPHPLARGMPGWLPGTPATGSICPRGLTGAHELSLSSELSGACGKRRGMIYTAFCLEKWKCRLVWSWLKWRKMIGGPFEKRTLCFYPTHFLFPFSFLSSYLKILWWCFLKLCLSWAFTHVHIYTDRFLTELILSR